MVLVHERSLLDRQRHLQLPDAARHWRVSALPLYGQSTLLQVGERASLTSDAGHAHTVAIYQDDTFSVVRPAAVPQPPCAGGVGTGEHLSTPTLQTRAIAGFPESDWLDCSRVADGAFAASRGHGSGHQTELVALGAIEHDVSVLPGDHPSDKPEA